MAERAPHSHVQATVNNVGGRGVGVAVSAQNALVSANGSITVERGTIQLPPRERFLATRQLRPVVASFSGREEELRKLEAAFSGGLCISAIQGMGGIGKTELALAFAHRIQSRYPDGQIFLDLKGVSDAPLAPREIMSHVIRSLTGETQLADDENALSAAYYSVLAGKRVLLVLDNAAGPEQVETLIPGGDCALLVTSRHQFTLAGVAQVQLDVLAPEKAEALLCKLCSRAAASASALAAQCGYLPLALNVIGNLLKTRDDLEPAVLIERLKGKLSAGLQRLEACINASFESLSPSMRQRWLALGVFPGAIAEQAAADVWGESLQEASKTLSDLAALSLILFNEKSRHYRLHDLMQQFARERVSHTQRAGYEHSLLRSYLRLLKKCNENVEKGGSTRIEALRLFDNERRALASAQALAAERSAKSFALAQLCIQFDEAGDLIRSLRYDGHTAVVWAKAALKAFQGVPPWARFFWWVQRKLRRKERARWSSLSRALYRARRYREAIGIDERIFASGRWFGRGEAFRVAIGLARLYSAVGDDNAAMNWHDCALSLKGISPDQKAEALNGKAKIERSRGKIDEVRRLLQEAAACARDEQEQCFTLCDLADNEVASGNIEAARADFERASQLARTAKITDSELEALRGLGDLAARAGDLAALERSLTRQLECAAASDDPRRELVVQRWAFATYSRIEQTALAQRAWERAVELSKKHADVIAYGELLAERYQSLPSPDEPAAAAIRAELIGLFSSPKQDAPGAELLRVSDGPIGSSAPELAAALQERALQYARDLKDLDLEWRTLQAIGRRHEAQRRPAEARQAFESALEAATSQQNLFAQRVIIRDIVETLTPRDAGAATKYLAALLELLQRTQDVSALQTALRLINVTELDPALEAVILARKMADLFAQTPSFSPVIFGLLQELTETAPRASAERVNFARRQVVLARKKRDPQLVARCVDEVAQALQDVGDPLAAQAALEAEMDFIRASGDQIALFRLLHSLAWLPGGSGREKRIALLLECASLAGADAEDRFRANRQAAAELCQSGSFKDALELCDRALESFPGVSMNERLSLLAERCQAQLGLGQSAAALATYRKGVAMNAENETRGGWSWELDRMAGSLERSEQLEAADREKLRRERVERLRSTVEAMRRDPRGASTIGSVLHQLANAMVAVGEGDEAERLLNSEVAKARASGSQSLLFGLLRGLDHFQRERGNQVDRLELLTELARLDDVPDAEWGSVQLERIAHLRQSGRLDDALAACNQAASRIARGPAGQALRFTDERCRILLALDRFDEALATFEKVFAIPDGERAPNGYVIDDLAKLLASNSHFSPAVRDSVQRQHLDYLQGELREVRKSSGLEVQTDFSRRLARRFHDMGEDVRAEQLLQEDIKRARDAGNESVLSKLLDTWIELNPDESSAKLEAIAEQAKLTRVDIWQRRSAQLRFADALLRGRRYEEALATCRAAAPLFHDALGSDKLRLMRAECLAATELGMRELALELYREAVALSPYDAMRGTLDELRRALRERFKATLVEMTP